MLQNKKLIAATSAAVLALMSTMQIASAASSKQHEQEEITAIHTAKISLIQAINSAEKHTNGKAIQAEYERSTLKGWVYEVEVAANNKKYDVIVDANNGKVISSNEDKHD